MAESSDKPPHLSWLRELYARDRDDGRPTVVLLSQVYPPDPAAVGQYMHQAACALLDRGYRVIAFAADSGFEDPEQRYLRYERLDGVHVIRLPLSSFGKHSLRQRLVAGAVFCGQVSVLAATLPRIDDLLISTSPPMIGAAGLAIARARRTRLSVWVMDINPDQIVSTGAMAADALPVRGFEWLNERTWSRAHRIITLDARMAERIRHKLGSRGPHVHVIPPWPLFSSDALDATAGARFRRAHGLTDKRVLMFSGNLSPHHPIDTLLEALCALRDDPRFVFVCVGGGGARRSLEAFVQRHELHNVRLLPYQPLSELRDSLSAADLHLVSIGEAMVGIVHPSKIYSAMAVGRPIFALGPRHSHIAELVHSHRIGWHVEHGDVAGAVTALRQLAAADAGVLAELGARAHTAIATQFDQRLLMTRFCELVVSGGVPVRGMSPTRS